MLKRNNTSAYKTLFKLISPTRYIVLYIAENLLNEADEDDEIVDVIIDEDGSIITVDFSEYDFPKAEFEGYCRVGLIYTLH